MTHSGHGSQRVGSRWGISRAQSGLYHRDICGPNDLAPFFDFCRHELAQHAWTAGKHRATQFSKPFLADPTAGEVRVGSIIYLAANFVSAVIERMSQQYPRMAFDLLATDNQALRRALESRAIDLLVAQKFGSFADQSLDFDALYYESYVVLAGACSPWARRRNIKLSDLVDEAWTLSSPETVIGGIATEAFRASGLKPPRVAVTTFPREVRMKLLATGRFLTISPTSIMKFSAKRSEFKVLPVQLPIAPVPVGIVSLKDRTPTPTSRLFVEHARAIAKSLAMNGRPEAPNWQVGM